MTQLFIASSQARRKDGAIDPKACVYLGILVVSHAVKLHSEAVHQDKCQHAFTLRLLGVVRAGEVGALRPKAVGLQGCRRTCTRKASGSSREAGCEFISTHSMLDMCSFVAGGVLQISPHLAAAVWAVSGGGDVAQRLLWLRCGCHRGRLLRCSRCFGCGGGGSL